MKKVTVVGSLNIDYVLKVNALPLSGETIILDGLAILEGGKGANQAASIGRLGISVDMFGKVGKDLYGEMLKKSLIESNVNVDGIITEEEESTGAAFITVDKKGNNTIVVNPGANNKITISDIESKKNRILSSDIIIIQMEIPIKVVSHTITITKDAGKVIILNFSPALDITWDVLNKVDYLILNEIEIERLTDIAFNQLDEKKPIRKLRKFFNGNIIVTLSKKGSICITKKNEIMKVPPFNVKPVDSTSAGDAFIGGFVYGIANRKKIEDCIIYGNACGALATTKIGAQFSLPNKKELDNFLMKNKSINIIKSILK